MAFISNEESKFPNSSRPGLNRDIAISLQSEAGLAPVPALSVVAILLKTMLAIVFSLCSVCIYSDKPGYVGRNWVSVPVGDHFQSSDIFFKDLPSHTCVFRVVSWCRTDRGMGKFT